MLPEEALFAGSLGVGFSTSATGAATTDNAVVVSFDAAPVQSIDIPKSTLDLAGNVWIHAQIDVNFQGADGEHRPDPLRRVTRDGRKRTLGPGAGSLPVARELWCPWGVDDTGHHQPRDHGPG